MKGEASQKPWTALDFRCGAQLCGAQVGEPCRRSKPHQTAPHDSRKKWAKAMNRSLNRRDGRP